MTTRDAEKATAARKSLDYVEPGMVVGLGSGTTATLTIKFLGEQVAKGLKILGVPTSELSAALARSLGIPLATLDQVPAIDVTIDGADEIAPGLQLIKGGGGNLLREKIVASCSKRLVIVADAKKMVRELGSFPLPVEVIKFGAAPVTRQLKAMGANPHLRCGPDGKAFLTDENNFIFDCAFGRISDPPAVARALKSIPGVVEHGLFLGMASLALVAGESGTHVVTP